MKTIKNACLAILGIALAAQSVLATEQQDYPEIIEFNANSKDIKCTSDSTPKVPEHSKIITYRLTNKFISCVGKKEYTNSDFTKAALAFLIRSNSTVVKASITSTQAYLANNHSIKLKENTTDRLLLYPNISYLKIDGPTKQLPPKRPASR